MKFYAFITYPDRCVAVRFAGRRGPCAHSRPEAIRRFQRSGLVASVKVGR